MHCVAMYHSTNEMLCIMDLNTCSYFSISASICSDMWRRSGPRKEGPVTDADIPLTNCRSDMTKTA